MIGAYRVDYSVKIVELGSKKEQEYKLDKNERSVDLDHPRPHVRSKAWHHQNLLALECYHHAHNAHPHEGI